jgi:hypothetical protein
MTYFDPSPSLTRMNEVPLENTCALDPPPPPVGGHMSGALLTTLFVSLWAIATVYAAHVWSALA